MLRNAAGLQRPAGPLLHVCHISAAPCCTEAASSADLTPVPCLSGQFLRHLPARRRRDASD